MDEAPPVDDADAVDRAEVAGAEYVVWREAGELVILNRSTRTTERRPAASGPLDPVGATSAALTIKTLMRLPEHGLAPGRWADLVVIDAESLYDAVTRLPVRQYVFKRGVMTAVGRAWSALFGPTADANVAGGAE